MDRMQNTTAPAGAQVETFDDDGISLMELVQPLRERWRLLAAGTVLAAAAGFGVASVLPKWYTARTVMLPPQQQQSAAAAAVSQLGALAGLAGNLGSIKSPADQYVALIQSVTVSDKIVDQFKLMDVYEAEFRVDARKKLAGSVRISAGKKDGLLTIEVDDREPQRAADMANAYVEALRTVTTQLAVTEAQQRRAFFEEQMKTAKDRLTRAQMALDQVGVGEGVLKAEPRSAAEGYARLKAETTAAEVRLQTLRRSLTETAPEVRQQEALFSALREQLLKAEAQDSGSNSSSDYISRYRSFKYEEALFEIFAKQYELARVDESREGALIQVVDKASTPERKAGPKRVQITAAAGMLAFLLLSGWMVARHLIRNRR
jgi:uncharacterized protein involved in exopolysaccharide biosynthesis